jgi:hypothetical protein
MCLSVGVGMRVGMRMLRVVLGSLRHDAGLTVMPVAAQLHQRAGIAAQRQRSEHEQNEQEFGALKHVFLS